MNSAQSIKSRQIGVVIKVKVLFFDKRPISHLKSFSSGINDRVRCGLT